MSVNNVPDKITDTITNVFKKLEVFENIGFYINSFLTVTIIFGITSISINAFTIINLDSLKKLIQENENTLKCHIEINRKRNLIEQCSLKTEILLLNNQLSLLLENQKKIILRLEEIQISNIEEKRISISVSNFDNSSNSTETDAFMPIKFPVMIDDALINNYIDENKDHEYDELTNECYDSIPLNNIKKNTGLSWLFK